MKMWRRQVDIKSFEFNFNPHLFHLTALNHKSEPSIVNRSLMSVSLHWVGKLLHHTHKSPPCNV